MTTHDALAPPARTPAVQTSSLCLTVLTAAEPHRLVGRIRDHLAGSPWRLDRAVVTGEQLYPSHRAAIDGATHVLELEVSSLDGGSLVVDEVRACLAGFDVVHLSTGEPTA